MGQTPCAQGVCPLKKKMKKNIIISLILIIILGFAAYGNSLGGKFIWDDEVLVKDNLYIRSYANLPKIFSEDIGAGGKRSFYFFRPIQMLTFMVDYSVWGLKVTGYHLTNLLLHIIAALLLFWLINLLFGDWLLGFLTAALFTVHPLFTAVVSYISGRADSLVLIFLLASFISYIRYLKLKTPSAYIVTLLSYTLSLLSKEFSLFFFAILLLYHYSFKKKLNLKIFLPIAGLALIYTIIRLTLLKSLLPPALSSTTLIQRIPGFFAALAVYFKLLILPFNLRMEYGLKVFSFSDPQVVLGMALFLFLLIYALRKRNIDKLGFFAIGWFFITILPVSNIFPINAYMAEHWMYLPAIGIFLITARGLSKLCRAKNFKVPAIIIIACVLIFYSLLTARQNNYWQDPSAFYKRTLKYEPENSRMYYNLAVSAGRDGKKEEAVSLFKKAIEINPAFGDAYNNLGVTYSDLGNKEQAIAMFNKALELDSNYVSAYNNRGLANLSLSKIEEAFQDFNHAIEIAPLEADAYINRGLAYQRMGKLTEAISDFDQAIKIGSDKSADAYYNRGRAYHYSGNLDQAISDATEAIEINPSFYLAYNNRGVAYQAQGKFDQALSDYNKAVELEPDNGLAYGNRAMIYYFKQDYDKSWQDVHKARELGKEVEPGFLDNLKTASKREK